jgi:hypothetical protein
MTVDSRKIRRYAASIILAWATTSCATVSTTAMQYVGAPRRPATDPASVQILQAMPAQPHERLGEISLTASTKPAPKISDLEDNLRQKAGTLGADAVVIVSDSLQPIGAYAAGGWWWSDRTLYTISGRRLVAVAIKYRQ